MFETIEQAACIGRDVIIQISRHRREILRTLLPLYAIWCIIYTTFVVMVIGNPAAPNINLQQNADLNVLMILSGMTIVSFIAVIWHRMVIMPHDLFPNIWRVIQYILTIFLTFIMAAVLVLPALSLLAPTVFRAGPSGSSLALGLTAHVISIGLTWLLLRIGPTLPAVGVGNSKVGFVDAWDATDGLGWPLLWLALGLHLLDVVIGFLTQHLVAISYVAGTLSAHVLFCVGGFFVLGILTDLYCKRILRVFPDGATDEPLGPGR